MHVLVSGLCGLIFNLIMNTTGYSIDTWQWWALFALLFVMYINGMCAS